MAKSSGGSADKHHHHCSYCQIKSVIVIIVLLASSRGHIIKKELIIALLFVQHHGQFISKASIVVYLKSCLKVARWWSLLLLSTAHRPYRKFKKVRVITADSRSYKALNKGIFFFSNSPKKSYCLKFGDVIAVFYRITLATILYVWFYWATKKISKNSVFS